MSRLLILLLTLAASLLGAGPGWPQTPTGAGDGELPAVVKAVPSAIDETVPPFGAGLFSSAKSSRRPDTQSPDYIVVPGDRLAVNLWGAVAVNQITTVDPEGNVFLPEIGPVHVAGARASDLNRLVQRKVEQVYRRNVQAYVALATATPITVFVTGAVVRPGQYAGLPSDTLLHFLQEAGGIDPARGSYRRIEVRRANRRLAGIDLYDFLRHGRAPAVRLIDGDVVFVAERGATVTVTGEVLNPFRFELASGETTGADIRRLARPLPEASHVEIEGVRGGVPRSSYVDLAGFERFVLLEGDAIAFVRDVERPGIRVRLEGPHRGPSVFTLTRGTRLRSFLDHVPVDPLRAATESIFLRRTRVVEAQQQLIESRIRALEESVLTGTARTEGEASIRLQEAKLIEAFAVRARQIRPDGRVIVARDGRVNDLRLEDGDVVVIPERSDLVLTDGEVVVAQAVVYDSDRRARDYIDLSGGFGPRADSDRIMVIHQSGAVDIAANPEVGPGDTVVALPSTDGKPIQIARDLFGVVYQVALTSGILLDLP